MKLSFSNYSAGLLFASWLSVAKEANAEGGKLIGSLVGCTVETLALYADVNLTTASDNYQSSMSFFEPDDRWDDLSWTVSFSEESYQAYQDACLVMENTVWDAYTTTTEKCVYGDTMASFTIHNYGECVPTTGACGEIAARGEAMAERLRTLLLTFGVHCEKTEHSDTDTKDSSGTEGTSGTELNSTNNLLTSAALSNSANPMALFSAASVATFLTMMLN